MSECGVTTRAQRMRNLRATAKRRRGADSTQQVSVREGAEFMYVYGECFIGIAHCTLALLIAHWHCSTDFNSYIQIILYFLQSSCSRGLGGLSRFYITCEQYRASAPPWPLS